MQAPLEQLAASFARLFGQIDIEKTDVLAGLALVQAQQAHQRKAAIADKLRASGMRPDGKQLQGGGCTSEVAAIAGSPEGTGADSNALDATSRDGPAGTTGSLGEQYGHFCQLCPESCPAPSGAAPEPAGPTAQDGRGAWQQDGGSRRQQQQQQQQHREAADGGHGGTASKHANSPGGAPDVRLDVDSPFFQWMQQVAEGRSMCLTPSRWGSQLAPQLTARQSAELYTGCTRAVEQGVLMEAQRWANFAVAAYGTDAYVWNQPKVFFWLTKSYWRARLDLRRSSAPAAHIVAAAKPPVQAKLQESRKYVEHYVAAQKVAGIPDDDFVYESFTNVALGATPYLICLHRASRTVVLAIRGSNSTADLLTDLMDRPVDISGWLPDDLRQEFPDSLGSGHSVQGHMGMVASAKALLQDLNRHQILPILMTGAPLAQEEQQRQHTWHEPDARQLRWERRRQSLLAAERPGRGRERSRQGARWQGVFDSRLASSLERSDRDLPALHQRAAAVEDAASPAASGDDAASSSAGSRQGREQWQRGSQDEGAAAGGSAGEAPAAAQRRDGGRSASGRASRPLEERLSPADYRRMLQQERGLDCRGWRLVVTGHSLGAAVAALVSMHIRSWCPGVRVWAFCPPGGMVTANLAHALEGFVTSVAVGKDSISRLGTVTFERLMDQMVLALARSRLPKLRVLMGLCSASLRKMAPREVFCPVDQIPQEALRYVRQFWESKCRFASMLVPMLQPGRVMLLRRLKEVPRSPRRQHPCGSNAAAGPPSSPRKGTMCGRRGRWQHRGGGPHHWDAVWIEAEQIVEEGILLSRHQASDHYTARLTQVLSDLTGRATTAQQAEQQDEEGEAGQEG